MSAYVLFADYSDIVDELMLLLPVHVTLPPPRLCGHAHTPPFTSGLVSLAAAQRATAGHCLLGHVAHTCGHLAAEERFYFRSNRFYFRSNCLFYFRSNRFYFRSNWSRVESELRDVRYLYSTARLYGDTIECPRRVLAAMATTIEQSRDCSDDVRWYSACTELVGGTNRLTESLIGGIQQALAGVCRCYVSQIVIYSLLICLQVRFLYTFSVLRFS